MVKETRTHGNPQKSLTYSLSGWEDGKPFLHKDVCAPDRWAVQSAEKITLQFGGDSILGDITLHQDPHSNELGGYLWTSSIVLAFYLEHQCAADIELWVKRKTVRIRHDTFLEIGAGLTGVPTIALRRLGKLCLATDIEELIVDLKGNVARNDSVNSERVSAFPTCLKLTWADSNCPTMNTQAKLVLDAYEQHGGLDVIVMADCIYSEASAQFLADTLATLSSMSLSRFLKSPEIWCISEVRNQLAQDEFVKCATEFFDVKLVEHSVFESCVPKEYRADFINFYRLRLKK